MQVLHSASTAASVDFPVFKPHAVRRESRCIDKSDGLSAVGISDFNLKRPESRPVRMIERLVRFRKSDGRLIYTDFLAALESQPRHTARKRVEKKMLSDPGMFDSMQSLQHNTTLLGVPSILMSFEDCVELYNATSHASKHVTIDVDAQNSESSVQRPYVSVPTSRPRDMPASSTVSATPAPAPPAPANDAKRKQCAEVSDTDWGRLEFDERRAKLFAETLKNEAKRCKNEETRMNIYTELMKNDQQRFIMHLSKINAFSATMTLIDKDWKISQPAALVNINNSLNSIVFGVAPARPT